MIYYKLSTINLILYNPLPESFYWSAALSFLKAYYDTAKNQELLRLDPIGIVLNY